MDNFPFSFGGDNTAKQYFLAVFKLLSPSVLIFKLMGVGDSPRTFKIKDRYFCYI